MNKAKKGLFVAAHILTLALIGYQGWLFVELIYFNEKPLAYYQSAPVAALSATRPKYQFNIDLLVHAHVFGIQGTPLKKAAIVLPPPVPSTKPYRIAGIAYSKIPTRSSVCLEIKPGVMEFFKPGDLIAKGVRLEHIGSDNIRCSKNSDIGFL